MGDKQNITDSPNAAYIRQHHGGLYDSIYDPALQRLVDKDSIELVEVYNDIFDDTIHDEEIRYLDFHIPDTSFRRELTDFKDFRVKQSIEDNNLRMLPHIPNPYPDLIARYVDIHKFHGRLIGFTAWPEYILLDSILFCEIEGPVESAFLQGKRVGNLTTYQLRDEYGKMSELGIKTIKDIRGLQIWRWTEGNEPVYYALKAPLQKAALLPNIIETSNQNEIVYQPKFESIDYDSIWVAN